MAAQLPRRGRGQRGEPRAQTLTFAPNGGALAAHALGADLVHACGQVHLVPLAAHSVELPGVAQDAAAPQGSMAGRRGAGPWGCYLEAHQAGAQGTAASRPGCIGGKLTVPALASLQAAPRRRHSRPERMPRAPLSW